MPKNLAALSLWMAVMSAPALAQTYSPPRTPLGHADFTGVWATSFVTPLERPDFEKRAALPAEETRAFVEKMRAGAPAVNDPDFDVSDVQGISVVRGEFRTSIIVDPPDGRMPFTEEGTRLSGRDYDDFLHAYDDPEIRPASERCIGGIGAPPMRVLPAVIPLRIVQTREHVVFHIEDVAGTRVARFGPPARTHASFEGDGVAWIEGDMLVVESTRFRPDMLFREGLGQSVIVGPGTTITERFTRLSDREMLYQFAVDDPLYYTQAWRGEYLFRRLDVMTYEYACHEANYSMPNILRGGRAEAERKAKEKEPN